MVKFLNQKISVLNALLVLVLLILLEIVTTIQIGPLGLPQTARLKNTTTTVLNPQLKVEATSSAQSTPSATPTPKLSIPASFGRSVNVPILMYHYIGNNPNPADKARDHLSVAPDLFEKQMAHLSSHGYTPITLDTLYAGLKGTTSLPGKPVVLTFDDGYIDFYVNAYPILKSFNFQAISFIPTGLVGTSYYLHWDQIKEMSSTGLISFQTHTVNHVNLPSMNNDQLTFQLVQSKKVLEESLGKPVNFMAYPYGTSDERVWAGAKGAGYLGAVGTWYGTTQSEGTVFDMPRVKISGSLPIEKFAAMFP